ncbi:hypothetical protein WR25_06547 [Diploscapter pachys]|uniref:Uncharacterized protein n=1 Tax=Diploscapter pachys TaxID=2018661 RepID=A0A2A2LWP7_9BILA|nr:hypothetical protein WR25_06547 [Diploscapter pachys]
MYLISFMDSRDVVQTDNYCGISGSVTEEFALYHSIFNPTCQVLSFLSSAYAFIYARKITKDTSKQLSDIRPILICSAITCVLICANSVIFKFALYILTGKDFRESLHKILTEKSTAEAREARTVVQQKPKHSVPSVATVATLALVSHSKSSIAKVS